MDTTTDSSLKRAIEAAGGVTALANALGIKPPSVSDWKRVPANRVLEVERLTGVSRHSLRPDVFGSGHQADRSLRPDIFDPAPAPSGQEAA